jgi:hypothetical protein
MPRLSAVDAFQPAFERVKIMLFRPFHFTTWLKIGFIGWLAGATYSGFNFNVPSFPGQEGGSGGMGGKEAEQVLRTFLHDHWLLIVCFVAFVISLALLLTYLSCRFRFILFDSVLQADAQIGRGWRRYSRQGQQYLGFMVLFVLVFWVLLALIVGLPVWHAYQTGIFSAENPLPGLFRVLVPVLLGVFVLVIASAIVSTLANDFAVPLLALDELTLAGAWSVLKQMISAEPGAFAGYLGMKLVLSIAAGVLIGIAVVLAFLFLLIPGAIIAVGGFAMAKAMGPVIGVLLVIVGVFAAIALVIVLSLLATAPIAVFFTAYAFYFFGGRYPKLGGLLWPQPIPPPLSPFSSGVPAPPGTP